MGGGVFSSGGLAGEFPMPLVFMEEESMTVSGPVIVSQMGWPATHDQRDELENKRKSYPYHTAQCLCGI